MRDLDDVLGSLLSMVLVRESWAVCRLRGPISLIGNPDSLHSWQVWIKLKRGEQPDWRSLSRWGRSVLLLAEDGRWGPGEEAIKSTEMTR